MDDVFKILVGTVELGAKVVGVLALGLLVGNVALEVLDAALDFDPLEKLDLLSLIQSKRKGLTVSEHKIYLQILPWSK